MKVLQERALNASTLRLTADNVLEEVSATSMSKNVILGAHIVEQDEILHQYASVTIGLLYQTQKCKKGFVVSFLESSVVNSRIQPLLFGVEAR